jgi:hypothetical protein
LARRVTVASVSFVLVAHAPGSAETDTDPLSGEITAERGGAALMVCATATTAVDEIRRSAERAWRKPSALHAQSPKPRAFLFL